VTRSGSRAGPSVIPRCPSAGAVITSCRCSFPSPPSERPECGCDD
jgi:hypothetical protein